jgi:acylglycerol lipase
VSIPLLVLHGSDDQVTDPKGSQELHDRASSKHKHIILYPGLLHDILFEVEKEEITEDIIRWLNERLSQLESCDEATLSSS